LSVHCRHFGLTKHAIVTSQEAKVHNDGVKPKPPYLRDAASTTTDNSFLDKISISPGIICNYGPSSMRPALKSQLWETRTHSLITSKQSINLPRSSSARFAGISNYSGWSVMVSVVKHTGVQTSTGSISLRPIVLQ